MSVKSVSEVQRPTFEGTPFEFFFRGQLPELGPMLRRGIGSGVLVDTSGHVLTNNHVVEGADKVHVVLANRHEYAAKVIGTDKQSDLAVLKLEQADEPLSPATLGDSDSLQVGQWVFAAGSPFGLQQTVSAGIVSALGRGNVGISDYEDFVQTDAAINPGNSGGPLVNLNGQVVGINTAIASSSGGNNGVGFAIPISMAKNVMDQLINTGKVVRGYIGLYIGNVTQSLAASFGYKGVGGALVQDVTPNGPAAKAGVRPGDIIFARDGDPVLSSADLRNGIAASKPDSATTLDIWRDGKQMKVKVELGELPIPGKAGPGQEGESMGQTRWGLGLIDASPAQRQHFKLGDTPGALIAQVKPESPADEAGLHAGDLITNVAGADVHDAQEAHDALHSAKSPVRLRILRDGHGLFAVLATDP